VCHIFGVNRKTNVSEHLAITLIEAIRRRRKTANQVWPIGGGTAQRLVPLPARNHPVVA